jgi:ribokinase
MLVLNEVEAAQYQAETGSDVADLAISDVIVTLGAQGCKWVSANGTEAFPAEKVTPVDTTGAGDTFTGYLIAGLDRGMPIPQAIGLATRAAALMVTRVGAADVIPDLREVQEFPRS